VLHHFFVVFSFLTKPIFLVSFVVGVG